MALPTSPHRNRRRSVAAEKHPTVYSDELLGMFADIERQRLEQESDPQWQKNNLEYDLRSTQWMVDKVKGSEIYSQNLYAALCNNEFQPLNDWEILKDTRWSCSWRYAGGIIADMRESGDYLDWYCSSTLRDIGDVDEASNSYVGEGYITDEIIEDLRKLGWHAIRDVNKL